MSVDANTAVLFPGQGSHAPDAAALVAQLAPDLYERCLELTGGDAFERAAESTRFAQPAIFCASAAAWRRAGLDPAGLVAVAGHSLGELAALVAAEALDEADALALVVERGRLMADAGERSGGGTMLALLGVGAPAADQLAADHGVTVANYNAPGQVVLSGAAPDLAAVATEAREAGLRAIDLGVAGAFHSPMMADAVDGFTRALDATDFRAPSTTVISCTTGAPMTDPRRELAAAITRPVRWADTMSALAALGATRFADAGPGTVVSKLARRNVPGADSVALADLEPARG